MATTFFPSLLPIIIRSKIIHTNDWKYGPIIRTADVSHCRNFPRNNCTSNDVTHGRKCLGRTVLAIYEHLQVHVCLVPSKFPRKYLTALKYCSVHRSHGSRRPFHHLCPKTSKEHKNLYLLPRDRKIRPRKRTLAMAFSWQHICGTT